jgi:organic radical activating enzyme
MKEMQDEKGVFEEHQRSKYTVLMSRYEEVQKQLHQKEEYNQQVVKDHIELKHVFELEERAHNEENESIRQENLHLRNSIRSICKDTNQTVNEAKKNYVENSEEFSSKFSEQNRGHNSNMSIIRD